MLSVSGVRISYSKSLQHHEAGVWGQRGGGPLTIGDSFNLGDFSVQRGVIDERVSLFSLPAFSFCEKTEPVLQVTALSGMNEMVRRMGLTRVWGVLCCCNSLCSTSCITFSIPVLANECSVLEERPCVPCRACTRSQ